MKYIIKKRWKLVINLISIPLVIFLLSWFFHNQLVHTYVDVKADVISRQFQQEIYRIIKDDDYNLTVNERKVLWDLAGSDKIKRLDITEFMNYNRIAFLIACTLSSITAMIGMKWYMNDSGDGLLISDEKRKGK